MKFSFDTIKDFDRHIELSIPNYGHITELILGMSKYFIKPKTNVYDLGCSTGSLLYHLNFRNELQNVDFIGYDIANNLRPEFVAGWQWHKKDLLTLEPIHLFNSSMIFSIFTLQFLPVSERWKLCKLIYDELLPGGAFIVCEKVYCKDGFINDVFTFTHFDIKKENGFSEEEILRKQDDLRVIMRPMTEAQNFCMLKDAGFTNIDCFFTSLQFKGWICVK